MSHVYYYKIFKIKKCFFNKDHVQTHLSCAWRSGLWLSICEAGRKEANISTENKELKNTENKKISFVLSRFNKITAT